MSLVKTFRSKGKLLITGEYTVLDGALALAIPVRLGQSLDVHLSGKKDNKIIWLAYKNTGELWFTSVLDIRNKKVEETSNIDFAQTLLHIFLQAKELGATLFDEDFGYECETHLEFPENWGLGSSSTLIKNIAKWLKVDPYQLLSKTFGGSGYDIACADADAPITYQLSNKKPVIKEAFVSSRISDNILFVYLNQKQDSREGIKHYKQKRISKVLIHSISEITRQIIDENCSFEKFTSLINEHERIISNFIEMKTIKEKLFSDYPGFIKSLGAWGGDFIMVEKMENTQDYFQNKGFRVIKEYDEFYSGKTIV